MREIEIKIRNISKKDIIKKVEELGARKNFSGKVIDYRFDTRERKLSKQGKALRLRQKGKYFYINLKGKKKSVEHIINRDEIGVKINNLKVMQKILNELGYIKIFELYKHRTEYKLNDTKFDIDEYLGLPPILEIESSSYEKVGKYIKMLQIEKESIGRIYMREILAAKKQYDLTRKEYKHKMSERLKDIEKKE